MLNPILRQNEIILKANLQENIEIVGFSNELGQSLINIVNNAKDALIKKSTNDKKVINITMEKIDGKVLITIADNGGGIDPDIIDNIFEPYFSTKQDKNGTGLGLYMSKTIIEEHCHGNIKVSSSAEGTAFEIVLID